LTRAVVYWHIAGIAKTLRSPSRRRAWSPRSPKDVGGGKLVVVAKDADGKMIGLNQTAK
jgi:hypothetical protein